MKRLLCALLVLAALVIPAQSYAMPVDPSLVSIVGATWYVLATDYSCTATAFAVNADGTSFLTAAHCATEAITVSLPGTALSAPATLVSKGPGGDQDWAVYHANVQAPYVIPLAAPGAAYIGEPIIVSGFPYGVGPVVTSGTVSGEVASSDGTYIAIYVFGAPGDSGSAVVSRDDHTIIGVLVGALSDDAGGPPVIVAVPVERVQP
jgi:S1-C subfamily serine protease